MFKPDFKTQTLIGYRVYGDCHVRASASVFRDDKAKKYEIRIRNIWGGCRAGGGTFHGSPLGLKYQATKDSTKQEYVLGISYIMPEVVCRALSQYDLWVLVPKLPKDYRINFETKVIKQMR
jgi:hypothetical protein